jgi:hypothetical protein
VAESTGAEVYAHPDPVLPVCEDIHVVIAAAHGAELCPGHVAQRSQLPCRTVCALLDLPCIVVVIVKQLVINLLFVLASDAEADAELISKNITPLL